MQGRTKTLITSLACSRGQTWVSTQVTKETINLAIDILFFLFVIGSLLYTTCTWPRIQRTWTNTAKWIPLPSSAPGSGVLKILLHVSSFVAPLLQQINTFPSKQTPDILLRIVSTRNHIIMAMWSPLVFFCISPSSYTIPASVTQSALPQVFQALWTDETCIPYPESTHTGV